MSVAVADTLTASWLTKVDWSNVERCFTKETMKWFIWELPGASRPFDRITNQPGV